MALSVQKMQLLIHSDVDYKQKEQVKISNSIYHLVWK